MKLWITQGAGWLVSALAWFGNAVNSSPEKALGVFGREETQKWMLQPGFGKEKRPSELLQFPTEDAT